MVRLVITCTNYDQNYLVCFSAGIPCFDFARIVNHLPVAIEDRESWMPKLFDKYYSSFVETLDRFKLDPPFTMENFIKDVESKGVFLAFICDMQVYKFLRPNISADHRRNIKFLAEKAARNDPKLFEC